MIDLSTRSPREHLLAMANARQGRPNSRWTILSIMRCAFGSTAVGKPPRELQATRPRSFSDAIGDAGQTYWREWLSPPDEPDEALIRLLATHTTLERLHDNRDFIQEMVDGNIDFRPRGAVTPQRRHRRPGSALSALPGQARSPAGQHVEPTSAGDPNRFAEHRRLSRRRCATSWLKRRPAAAQEAARAAVAKPANSDAVTAPWRHRRLDKPAPKRAEAAKRPPAPYRQRPRDGATAQAAAPVGETRQARVKRRGDVLHVARARGRKPDQFKRVLKEMRERVRNGDDLSTWTEEAMATTFKASRDTCRRARDQASASRKMNSRQ